MRTLTIKVPDALYLKMQLEAAKRKIPISDIGREMMGIDKVDDNGEPLLHGSVKLRKKMADGRRRKLAIKQ